MRSSASVVGVDESVEVDVGTGERVEDAGWVVDGGVGGIVVIESAWEERVTGNGVWIAALVLGKVVIRLNGPVISGTVELVGGRPGEGGVVFASD